MPPFYPNSVTFSRLCVAFYCFVKSSLWRLVIQYIEWFHQNLWMQTRTINLQKKGYSIWSNGKITTLSYLSWELRFWYQRKLVHGRIYMFDIVIRDRCFFTKISLKKMCLWNICCMQWIKYMLYAVDKVHAVCSG